MPEYNGKPNTDESYTKKYLKHFACSYDYKLIYAIDKFTKSFKSYLGDDAVYSFINSMMEKSKYRSNVFKKHFNKELALSKKDNESFENSTKCWVCNNVYVNGDVIFISLKNKEVLQTEIAISRLS